MRDRTLVRLAAVFLAVVVCGHSSSAQPAVPAGSEPYTGTALDAYVLARPTPADRPSDLVIYDGEHISFAADGRAGANEKWRAGKKNSLYVEAQRRGLDVVQAGVASGSVSLIEIGLKAIEWGLQAAVLGADGSFPDQRDTRTAAAHAIHPKSEFVEAAARMVLLMQQSAVVPVALRARANALVPRIHLAAQHFIDSGDVASFFTDTSNSSQLAFVAAGIFEAGRLASDSAMMATADAYMQQILSLQRSNGVYPEKDGSDTSYQLNTVELVTTYTAMVTDPAWRATLLAANTRAVDWFLSRVRNDGSINTAGNTRTRACGRRVAGTGPKDIGIDTFAIRLYFHAYLAGLLPEIGPVADRIQTYGQNYDHATTCNGLFS